MYNILSWEVVDVDAATQSMKVGASFALDAAVIRRLAHPFASMSAATGQCY